MMKGPIEPFPKTLESCGDLTMLVGTKDKFNLDPSQNYLKRLQEKRANIKYEEFDGDHNIYEEPVRQAIEKYLNTPS